MSTEERTPRENARLGLARLVVGAIQGAVIYAVILTGRGDNGWGAGHPALYGALWVTSVLAPFVLLGGLGVLRRRTLVLWGLGALILCMAFGFHDVWRQAGVDLARPRLSAPAWIATAAFLFIAHHLIVCGDRARRLFAPYPAYFDTAWKDAVQLILAAVFVGVFWGVLHLGAALFKLIGVEGFRNLLRQEWFGYPATTLMFAAAIHLTDVRVSLIRGVRTVVLMLLSWLTPLMALIAAAFLISLPLTGLRLLWATGHATAVLLASAAALIILLNALYQDGAQQKRGPDVLRWSGRLAAILPTPLVLLAAYGLALRVGQYGWTPDRVIAAACIIVGACYAGGYLFAAVRRGRWLAGLERTNLITALVALVVLLSLFSPLADPARLSVFDQTARLRDGRTAVDAFDFRFLRFEAGRFGVMALKRIQADPPNREAGKRAAEALASRNRWAPAAMTPAQGRRAIPVYPQGQGLPDSFFRQPTDKAFGWDPCLQGQNERGCAAFLVDLNDDGRREILLGANGFLNAYAEQPGGEWRQLGALGPMDCVVLESLKRGEGRALAPAWPDFEAGGRRLRLTPAMPLEQKPRDCPTSR